MRSRVFPFVLFVLFVVPSSLLAQPERYELGRRLRNFERAWDEQTDPAIRKKALVDLPKVTNQFFSFQLGEAGRTLEEAAAILRDRPRTEEEIWLSSLYATTPFKLFDADQKEIEITLKPFYKAKGKPPKNSTFETRMGKSKSGTNEILTKVPFTFSFALESIDRKDGYSASSPPPYDNNPEKNFRDDMIATVTNIWFDVSRVKNLNIRLAALKKAVEALPSPLATIEQATQKDYYELLADVASGSIPESDISLGDLFAHAEWFATNDKPFFVPKPKDSWYTTRISFPTGVNQNTTPTRVYIPSAERLSKPVPCVIALHGAGGSENLFVEGYGNGRIVRECQERGWILISPRSPGLLGIAPVTQLVDRLAARFPIDESKIFLVGHSMGAAQTVELCQKHPGYFAGAAALGGGGRVRDAKPFTDLPFFVGVGEKDFALAGAKGLKKALSDGGAKKLTYKEYPDLEHLVIVREALPDAFEMFDAVVAGK